MNKQFPSPPLSKIISKAHLFLKDDLSYYQYFLETYGDMVFMQLGDFEMLLANDPGFIQHVLKTNYTNYSKPKALRELAPLLKDGIFFLEDEAWRKEVQILKPAFHQSMIALNEYVVKEEVEKTFRYLDELAVQKKSAELSSLLRNLFLTILIRTQCSPAASVDQKRMIHLLSVLLDGVRPIQFYTRVIKKEFNNFVNAGFFNDPFPAAAQEIEDMMMEVFYAAESGKIEATGILSMILTAYKDGKIDLATVRGEMRNLVFAGMDTVADSMTWFMNNLMLHKEIQNTCRDEVIKLSEESILSYNLIDRFVYFYASFRESLRLNPSVWAFHRMTLAEDSWNGYRIPKGVWIFISPLFLHRNGKYWDEPMKFKPERFIGTTIVNPFYYIPFGQGPHYCLGSRIAQLQIMQITGSLIKRYEFTRSSSNNKKFYAGVMLHPAHGLYADLKKI
ncbi:MAG: cytochrome P450 [Ignavibacteriales bacterium]|nr:MAG: cytochrome P450 [Ignavibacteriales bacterium]